MEPLADAVGLRGHRLCFRVFYIVYCQIKLIIMLLYFAAVLRASVGQVFSASAGPETHKTVVHDRSAVIGVLVT